MMAPKNVFWRFAPFEELRPAAGELLAALDAAERRELDALRHPGRREQWLLARVLARGLIRAQVAEARDERTPIVIQARDARGRGMRPLVSIDRRPIKGSLSFAHAPQATLAAFSLTPGVTLGVDLAPREPLGKNFEQQWLTAQERAELASWGPLESVRAWTIKEAVYKALNEGESFAPRRIRVRRAADGHYACSYHGQDLSDRVECVAWDCEDNVAALAVMIEPARAESTILPPSRVSGLGPAAADFASRRAAVIERISDGVGIQIRETIGD